MPLADRLDLLAPYLDDPRRFPRGRYAFCVTDGDAWVGCSLRNWSESPLSFWRSRYWTNLSFLFGHPLDKLGLRSCRRLANRAAEKRLFGSTGIASPPQDRRSARYYRRGDDAVWMHVKSKNSGRAFSAPPDFSGKEDYWR